MKEQIIHLYNEGLTTKEIGRRLNKSSEAIRQKLIKYGVRRRASHRRAEKAPWNKGRKSLDPIKQSVALINSNEYHGLHECTIRKHIKRYLVDKNGHRCEICNTSAWCGQPVPLVCDHIDGDSTNNELKNFRLVCQNCNAQLPTFGSKNRGNGRQYDRELKRRKSKHGK